MRELNEAAAAAYEAAATAAAAAGNVRITAAVLLQ